MISRREWTWVGAAGAAIVVIANLPYLAAYAAPSGQVFGGILFAFQDGFSYLAKMRQGWRGEWLFTLPYTAEPGAGVFLYTYYLFLGHLARWTGLSLEAVYHGARLAGGGLMLGAAYRLIARFVDTVNGRWRAWLLFSLGSGLGWLAAPWLPLPPDWWITEALPFLSLISNAHFPLAWALLLFLLEVTLPGVAEMPLGRRLAWAAAVTLMLSQVQLLALIPAGVVLGGATVWRAARRRVWRWADWLPALVVAAVTAPWALQAVWLTQTHPALRAWNAQNLTPSPAPLEALVWGGLPLLLALRGGWLAARRRWPPADLLLLWLGLGVALIYAPVALQRRLSMGVWLPICLLAEVGIAAGWPRWAKALGGVAATLSSLLVWAALWSAALTRRPEVYLTLAEADAIARLPAGALVLAAPETGTLIPARSDARVLYGHQFETADAARQRQAVEDFFAGRAPQLPDTAAVDVVFYGPREAALGPAPQLPGWRILWQAGAVRVYGR